MSKKKEYQDNYKIQDIKLGKVLVEGEISNVKFPLKSSIHFNTF